VRWGRATRCAADACTFVFLGGGVLLGVFSRALTKQPNRIKPNQTQPNNPPPSSWCAAAASTSRGMAPWTRAPPSGCGWGRAAAAREVGARLAASVYKFDACMCARAQPTNPNRPQPM
jgi:hypothetical protein